MLSENRVVIVTGAGAAIGHVATIGLRQVVASDENPVRLQPRSILSAALVAITGDVSRAGDVQQALSRYGGLDCAFNYAGITHADDDHWKEAVFRKTIES